MTWKQVSEHDWLCEDDLRINMKIRSGLKHTWDVGCMSWS